MEIRSKKLVFVVMLTVLMGLLIGSASSALADVSGNYTYTVTNDKATITDFKITDSLVVTIPSELGGYTVTAIGDGAFQDCGLLTRITIPSSVTRIGDNAFNNCNSLSNMTIPINVTSIGDYAFAECSKLTTVTLQGNINSMGQGVFAHCYKLTGITIPGSVNGIGYMAFFNCDSLTNIAINSGVKSIGESAFYGCGNLTSITIPGSITSIGKRAFGDCSKLSTLNLQRGLIIIGDSAFRGCSSLTNVTIPYGLTTIRSAAFSYCSNLEKITLPDSVKTMYSSTFEGCDDLTIYGYAGSFAQTYAEGNDIPFETIAVGTLALNSVTCDKTSAFVGDTVTYTINATGGKEPFTYSFKVYKDNAVIFSGNYGDSNKYTYKFLAAGVYKVQGFVKDASNQPLNKYSASINVIEKLAVTNVTCNKSSAAVGGSATYTIEATGGVAPLSYCFYVYKNGTAIYKGVYKSSNTFTYTYHSTGSYKVQGYVKDANNTRVNKYSTVLNVTATLPLAITSVTANKTSATTGDTITYTINATGGIVPLTYCFYVYKDNVAVYKGSYGTSDKFNYTFPSVGSYKVQGYVKDKANTKKALYSAPITVTAAAPLAITSVSCNKTSAAVGDSATYTINATGGKAPFSYCFYVFKNNQAILKGNYSSAITFTYTFKSVGSYKVQGYVLDKFGVKVAKYSSTINVVSVLPLVITKVNCNMTIAAVNDTATYTVSATGGKAPLSYCFYVYKNGTAIYKGSYTSSSVFSYKFTSPGSYKVQGYVKDKNDTKVSKYSSVLTVTAP